MTEVDSRKEKGMAGENIACHYLISHGYELVARNFRTRCGEIDIVARKEGIICFVEVRTLRFSRHYFPSDTVTYKKQRKLSLMAGLFLEKYYPCEMKDARFDVIAIQLIGKTFRLEHFIDAFPMRITA